MLLVAAGLMLRSFQRLMAGKTGMNPDQVATLETSFPSRTPDVEQRRIINGVVDRLSRQTGLIAAGAVNDLPLRGEGGISVAIEVPGAPPRDHSEPRCATGRDLLALVSREMVVAIAFGIVAGLAGAWMLGRVLSSLLYDVNPRDPTTFIVVPLFLLLRAVIATLVPALRAARVDPTQVMRAD